MRHSLASRGNGTLTVATLNLDNTVDKQRVDETYDPNLKATFNGDATRFVAAERTMFQNAVKPFARDGSDLPVQHFGRRLPTATTARRQHWPSRRWW